MCVEVWPFVKGKLSFEIVLLFCSRFVKKSCLLLEGTLSASASVVWCSFVLFLGLLYLACVAFNGLSFLRS